MLVFHVNVKLQQSYGRSRVVTCFDASDPGEGLAEAQQIKVARPPTVLRHTHSGKGPISLKDLSDRGRVALPFKVASSSQA